MNSDLINKLLSYCKEEDGCLVWTRCLNTDGYPRVSYMGNENTKVHRLIYELHYCEDISGKVVRHKCDNPKCINPDHLVSGTPSDNVSDRVQRGRTFRKLNETVIRAVLKLCEEDSFTNRQIADIVGIDERRVSDIRLGKRDMYGKILRR